MTDWDRYAPGTRIDGVPALSYAIARGAPVDVIRRLMRGMRCPQITRLDQFARIPQRYRDDAGNTPLMYALAYAPDDLVMEILKVDSVDTQNHEGTTPLMVATSMGRSPGLIGELLSRARSWSISARDKDGNSCFDYALRRHGPHYMHSLVRIKMYRSRAPIKPTSVGYAILHHSLSAPQVSMLRIVTQLLSPQERDVLQRYVNGEYCSRIMAQNEGHGSILRPFRVMAEPLHPGMEPVTVTKFVTRVMERYSRVWSPLLRIASHVTRLSFLELWCLGNLTTYHHLCPHAWSEVDDASVVKVLTEYGRYVNTKYLNLEMDNLVATRLRDRDSRLKLLALDLSPVIVSRRVPIYLRQRFLDHCDVTMAVALLARRRWSLNDSLGMTFAHRLANLRATETQFTAILYVAIDTSNDKLIPLLLHKVSVVDHATMCSALRKLKSQNLLTQVITKYMVQNPRYCLCGLLGVAIEARRSSNILRQILHQCHCNLCGMSDLLGRTYKQSAGAGPGPGAGPATGPGTGTGGVIKGITEFVAVCRRAQRRTPSQGDVVTTLGELMTRRVPIAHFDEILDLLATDHEEVFHCVCANLSAIQVLQDRGLLGYLAHLFRGRLGSSLKTQLSGPVILTLLGCIAVDCRLVEELLSTLTDVTVDTAISWGRHTSVIGTLIAYMTRGGIAAVSWNGLLRTLIHRSKNLDFHVRRFSVSIPDVIDSQVVEDDLIGILLNVYPDPRDHLYGASSSLRGITITVDVTNPFRSVRPHLHDQGRMQKKWKLEFQNQMGSDGGGLSKQFFFELGRDLGRFFTVSDGFLIPDPLQADPQLWFDVGVILGKAVVVERRMTGLRLHPYIIHRLVSPGFQDEDLTVDFARCDARLRDLDTVRALSALARLSREEWLHYMDVQGEDAGADAGVATVAQYCDRRLRQEYGSTRGSRLADFLAGFWLYADQTKIKYLTAEKLESYILGRTRYKIRGGLGSLEHELVLCSPYREPFLTLLDDLQESAPDKLRDFFKFWFGTPCVEFTEGATITMYATIKQKVCYSHTCGNELDFPIPEQEIRDDPARLREWLAEVITNSLENQRRAEEANLHMQAI